MTFTSSGDCSTSGVTVTLTGVGTCTITAHQDGNANYNAASDVAHTFNVGKVAQTIAFNPLGAKTYGDSAFTVSATATSGLTVTFTTAGGCTNSDTTITITGASTCTVTAHQAGNATYSAATDVDQSFTIAKATQTITFNPITSAVVTDDPFVISATASSGLAVTFTTSGPYTNSGATITLTGTGTCIVTAHQVGNSNYLAANDVARGIGVDRAEQTITFGALADKTYGDAPFTVTATASSGLAVEYSTSGPCTNTGATITITGAGTCIVTADQDGDATYYAAPSAGQAFGIAKIAQTIDFPPHAAVTVIDDPFDVSATASSGLPVTYTTTGPCTNAGPTITVTGTGTCIVNAHQPGNSYYETAPSPGIGIGVDRADQSITFAALADKTYGDAPFTVSATASSGLEVDYSTSGPCTNTGATITITGAGLCVVGADQDGDTQYYPAPSVGEAFTIVPADQTITFPVIEDVAVVTVPFDVSATASSGLAVTFATSGDCSNSGVTVTVSGVGTCTATAHQAGNANYNAAPDVARSFSVSKAIQTIDFAPHADVTAIIDPFAVSATATSGLTVTFTTSGNCTNSGPTITVTAVGTCTVTAHQAGNGTYNAAPDVARTFNIGIVHQTITFGALVDKTYGDAPFTVTATASSGLTVTFSASGACTNSGARITITGAGTCTATASQAGNASYDPAADVARAFTVAKADQVILFAAIDDKTVGDAPFTVLAGASSGLVVSFEAEGACTVSDAKVSVTIAGTCTIRATQAGTANYNAAPDVMHSFAVNPAAAASPPPTPDLSLDLHFDVGTRVDDATVTITAHDLLPGSIANVTVHSTPRLLARVVVDDTGSFTTTVKLPADLEAGDHRIIVEATAADGTPVTKWEAFAVDSSGVIVHIGALDRTTGVAAPKPAHHTEAAPPAKSRVTPPHEDTPTGDAPTKKHHDDGGSPLPLLVVGVCALVTLMLTQRRRLRV